MGIVDPNFFRLIGQAVAVMKKKLTLKPSESHERHLSINQLEFL